MKTYQELNAKQQQAAQEVCLQNLVQAVAEGALRFNDDLNHDDLQARIDAAAESMENSHTPWFFGEAVLETCREELEGMAYCDAEDSLYAEKGECVIEGIIGG